MHRKPLKTDTEKFGFTLELSLICTFRKAGFLPRITIIKKQFSYSQIINILCDKINILCDVYCTEEISANYIAVTN